MDWILTPVTLVSGIFRKLASPIFWYYGFSVITGQFSFFLFIMVVSIIIIIIIIIITIIIIIIIIIIYFLGSMPT